MSPELRALFWKEGRQLLRSKTALATALFFPLLFLIVIPITQMIGVSQAAKTSFSLPPGLGLPPGIAGIERDPAVLVRTMLPLFVMISGLVVPSLSAVHTLLAEREQRTLELLIALPVRVGQVIAAKLLVLVAASAASTFTLLAVNLGFLLGLGLGSPTFAGALVLLLVCSLAYSTTSALLVSLLARDYRTANNLNGALLGPLILLALALLVLLPGDTQKTLALAGLLALLSLGATFAALRVVTFERLLQ